jgi:hypothetical protein
MTLSRPCSDPKTRRKLNHVSPRLDACPSSVGAARLVTSPDRPRTSPLTRRSTRWRRAPGRTLWLLECAADFIAWSCGITALLNFFVSRPKPGSYPTHDGADAFHALSMETHHGKFFEQTHGKK